MENSELIYEEGLQISYEVGKLSTEEFTQLLELISDFSNKKNVNDKILMLTLKVVDFRVKYKAFPPKFLELSPLGEYLDESFIAAFPEYKINKEKILN